MAVGGFADHLEMIVPGEAGADAFADDRVIVDEEDLDSGFHAGSFGAKAMAGRAPDP